MTITDILLKFREEQNLELLGIFDEKLNIVDLNVVVIEILSWLKLEHKRTIWIKEGRRMKHKNLVLNENFSWCTLLKKLLDTETIFHNVFEVNGSELSFTTSVDEEYINEARRVAFEKYNPIRVR